MTCIINRMNGYEKEKMEQNITKKAASTLMYMMSGKRGETSNDKEMGCNQIDDDNNCEAAAKQSNNSIEHDINCVVDANKGKKDGVEIKNEEGKEVDKEFDIDSLYNQDYNYTDIDGAIDGNDNRMIAAEHVCVDDRKCESNGELKDNDDDYNNDDGGE